jgi:hypothetical protein
LSADEIAKVLEGKLNGQTTLISYKQTYLKLFAKEIPALKHSSVLGKEHVFKNNMDIQL